MSISLAPETEQLIQRQLDSGRYHSANDVVLEGLRLLNEQEQSRKAEVEEIKRKIEAGAKELDEGKGIELTDEVFDSLLQRVKEKANSRNQQMN